MAEVTSGNWQVKPLLASFRSLLAQGIELSQSDIPTCVLSLKRYKNLDLIEKWRFDRTRLSNGIAIIQEPRDPLAVCVEYGLKSAAPLLDYNRNHIDKLNDAVSHLRQKDEATWREFSECVDFIGLVNASDFRSSSSPVVFGCIVLTRHAYEQTTGDLATSLVHELAHQELFLINTLDRLIRTGREKELSFAPFQASPRPPIARFHALAALFRMAQFRSKADLPIDHVTKNLRETADTLPDEILTDFGYALRNSYLRGSYL